MFLSELDPPSVRGSADEFKIPGKLFQTWFSHRIPTLLYREIERFWMLNERLQIRVFSDADCDRFMEEYWAHHPIYEIYQSAQFGPMKSDIFRYCIIYTFGGYYCDISKGVRRDLRSFHSTSCDGLVSFEGNESILPVDGGLISRLKYPQHYLCNWCFGFDTGHPFLERLIDNIVAVSVRYRGQVCRNPKIAILQLTGPGMFTHTFHKYVLNESVGIAQAGIDFDGFGQPNLKFARLRYLQKKSYKKAKSQVILR